MLRSYSMLILLLLAVPCLAQQRIYHRLDADQIETAMLNSIAADEFFQIPFDSTPFYEPLDVKGFPTGIYAATKFNYNQLEAEFFQHFDYRLYAQSNGQDVLLRIADTLGRVAPNASLWRVRSGKNKAIPYEEEVAAFRLKKWNRSLELGAVVMGDTVYYDLRRNGSNLFGRRLRRFVSRPEGWVVRPFYRIYHYFRSWFYYGSFHPRWPRFSFRWLKRKSGNGYAVLSQPEYRLGDTLHFSAYLTKASGKPLRRPAELRLGYYDKINRRWRDVLNREIEPAPTPGRYTFDYALPDSLPVDYQYQLTISGGNKFTQTTRFYLSDYELDRNEYSAKMPYDAYASGEPVRVTVAGTNAAGNAIADAEVYLLCRTRKIEEIYADSLFVPDTLWTDRLPLNGTQNLTLPDSIFPPALLHLTLEAHFLDPGGEQKTETLDFTYQGRALRLRLSLDGSELLAESLRAGTSERGVFLLDRKTKLGTSTQLVQTPFREAISPYVSEYTLRDTGELYRVNLRVRSEKAEVSYRERYTRDSISRPGNSATRK